VQETFRLFQQMQTPQAQAQPATPSPPPQGSDPATMMAWMLQKMQQPPQSTTPPPPDPMEMMGRMFEMFQKMQQVVQPPSQPGPYRGPGLRSYPGDSFRYPSQAPAHPKTAAEEFRDAATIIETAVGIADRFRPQAPAADPSGYRNNNDDDNPVKVMDVGGVQVLINKDDGSARKWETGVALIPTLLKWAAEQREAIMKTQAEREAKQRRQQQSLPPGYVEVGPGYQPPAGYVAVPVDQLDSGLPPQPENMPPPITEQESPPRSRTWGAPPMPGGGE
jgi:hypothetical protein